ncbi:MAG: head completion protein [Candidatus Thorarchaeota archaeon]|nr:MAG: head completion protein [Candidatus Thorarchaeota archaeon]
MNKRFLQGRYTPKNPHKYKGDLAKIIYRSSYELEMCQFLDNNTRVLKWSSEEIIIPYVKPTDGKVHRYFPDYWVEYVNRDGEILQEIIEVKPKVQTKTPRSNGKYALYEKITYNVNLAKWRAANLWCQEHNMKFRIITERSVFK